MTTRRRSNSLGTIERAIARALKDRAANTLEVGRLLLEAKARVPHGAWLEWVEARFPLSIGSAENYMNAAQFVAERGLEFATVANMAATTLYDLAAGRLTDEAADEVLRLAQRGRVSAKQAVEINAAALEREWAARRRAAWRAARGAADEAKAARAEAEAVLDGAPPALPPPGEAAGVRFDSTTPNPDVEEFRGAVAELFRLSTRLRAQDAAAGASPHALRAVADFIGAVLAKMRAAEELRVDPPGELRPARLGKLRMTSALGPARET